MVLNEVLGYAMDALTKDAELNSLVARMESEIPDVFAHSRTVMVLAAEIGLGYGFDLDRLIRLGVGAMLHDIGKLETDRNILYKPDSLTDREFAVMEAHALSGYNMLHKLTGDGMILDIALNHHSKIDGTGYPFLKSGSEISIFTQIVTVSDIYDALVSERVYKPKKTKEEAFRELKGMTGVNQPAVDILERTLDWGD